MKFKLVKCESSLIGRKFFGFIQTFMHFIFKQLSEASVIKDPIDFVERPSE